MFPSKRYGGIYYPLEVFLQYIKIYLGVLTGSITGDIFLKS